MKILGIDVLVLGDPPDTVPDGRIDELPVLRVRTHEGFVGWSEVFNVPAAVAVAALDGPQSFYGRKVAGRSITDPRALWTELYDTLLFSNRRGWSIACLGALDVAIWDIHAQALGKPVYQVLGGSIRDPYQQPADDPRAGGVVPYCTVYSHERDAQTLIRRHLERIEQARGAGYTAIKLEPLESSVTTIIELSRLAREVVGPACTVGVDVGYRFTDWHTALDVARRIAEFEIDFLETPLPVDLLSAYRELAVRSPIRIAAGEHATTRWEIRQLGQAGVDVVQPYSTTVGGLTEMARIIDDAAVAGIQVVPGNWSTALLSAANVHAAAISRVSPFIETGPALLYRSPLRDAIEEIALKVINGLIPLPTEPGIGVQLPNDLLRHFELR